MARVSVIVPVYNVERHLDECLASIEGQTLDDLEIVCVNDGSTDHSSEILAAHAARDPRMRIIDQQNGGLSSARNVGITAARSPYLCFVDSDDRLVASACQRIAEVLDASGADLLTFGGRPFPAELSSIWLDDVLSPRTVRYDAFSIDLLFKERSRPFVWRTACRADFLARTGLAFDETLRYGEDQAFHFAAYPRARRVQLLADKLYEYRLGRQDSLMGALRGDLVGLCRRQAEIVAHVLDDWEELGILDQYASEMVAWTVELILFNALRLDGEAAALVCGEVAAVLREHWDEHELRALSLRPSDRAIVNAALSGKAASRHRRNALRSASMRERYGMRAWVAWVARGRD